MGLKQVNVNMINYKNNSYILCPCYCNYGDNKFNNIISGNDFCAASPCKYGGTCVNEPFGYRCECDIGYTGDNCDQRKFSTVE